MDNKLKNLQVATTISQTATEHSPSISGKILTDEDTRPALKQWREKSNSHEQCFQSSNDNPSEKAVSSSSIQPAEEVFTQEILSAENTSSYLSKSSRVSNNNSLFFIEAFSK